MITIVILIFIGLVMRVFLKPTRDLRGIYFNYKFGALYVVIPDR